MARQSSPNSTPAGMPLNAKASLGRLVGVHLHFDSNADLQIALAANTADPLWADGSHFTVSGETGTRRFDLAGNHVRNVDLLTGKRLVLAASVNAVTSVTGAPTGGNPNDVAVNYSAGVYWTNNAGTWTQTGTILPSTAVRTDNIKTVGGVSLLGTGDIPAGSAPTTLRVADTATIPLDRAITSGGTAAPSTPGGIVRIVSPRTFTAGAQAPNGYFAGDYMAGAAVGFDPAFKVYGGPVAVGDVFNLQCSVLGATPVAVVTKTGTADVSPPMLGNPVIAAGDATHVTVPVSDASGATLTGTASNVRLSGKAVTAVALASNVLTVTFTPAAVSGDAITLAADAGLLTDTSPQANPSLAVSGLAITNNLVLAVPAGPVLTAGSNTQTAINFTVSPRSGSSGITSYTTAYKLHTASTYTAGPTVAYAGTSTPVSITGLTAGSAYDVTATASNSSGPGATSAVLAISTSAPTATLSVASVANVSTDLTAAAYLDWAIQNNAYGLGGSSSLSWSNRKAGANLLGQLGLFNATVAGNSRGGDPAVLSYSDAADGTGGNNNAGLTVAVVAAAGPGGFRFTAPAGPTARKCRVWIGAIEYAAGRYATVRGVLSDGSAPSVSLVVDARIDNGFACAEFTFSAATAGQTLTVTVEGDPAATAQVSISVAAYY